jgi:hypothetical protein
MRATKTTDRHWTEKIAPSLLAILSVQKTAAEEIKKLRGGQLQQRQALQHRVAIENYFVWPFRLGSIPDPPQITDTIEQLKRKLRLLGREHERFATEYVAPIHCGIPFPGWGQPLPECPVTIEAEHQFVQDLGKLTRSYFQSRPSRRQAVLRKLAHSTIAWLGIYYGAWLGARNQFTIEVLSWQEIKDLFDSWCFGECEDHTPEQVRKIIKRHITAILQALPSNSISLAHQLLGPESFFQPD